MPRTLKDLTRYACAYCGERFVKMADHMSHVIEQHDKGARGDSERLRRPISCWRCGTRDVYPSGEDNWFYCACGWELPREWTNGQLTVEAENESLDATRTHHIDDTAASA